MFNYAMSFSLIALLCISLTGRSLAVAPEEAYCRDLYGVDVSLQFRVINESDIGASFSIENASRRQYEVTPEFIPWINGESVSFMLIDFENRQLRSWYPPSDDKVLGGAFRQKIVREELSRLGRQISPGHSVDGSVIFRDVQAGNAALKPLTIGLVVWRVKLSGDSGGCVQFGIFRGP